MTLMSENLPQKVTELFGAHRTEQLQDFMYEVYREPKYFPELETARPCFLIGGRGTGKTTTLRALSYEGKFAIEKQDKGKISQWKYYGFYFKALLSISSYFEGGKIEKSLWQKLFSHYLNLVFSKSVIDFLYWYSEKTEEEINLSSYDYAMICQSLHIDKVSNLQSLSESISISLNEFESSLGNLRSIESLEISTLAQPLEVIFTIVKKMNSFKQKNFFLMIDEFENLNLDQQQIVNTLIKHCGDLYTLKIGVKELGIKIFTTINNAEFLNDPADYSAVDITKEIESGFQNFAKKICNARLDKIKEIYPCISNIVELFPTLSLEEEAELLGIKDKVKTIKASIGKVFLLALKDNLSDLKILFLFEWSKKDPVLFEKNLIDFSMNTDQWNKRYENYKYALLFTIKKNRVGHRKFYAGWSTFIALSGGNIRYLLLLVEKSILLHLSNSSLEIPISAHTQTDAVKSVATSNIKQIEGKTVNGRLMLNFILGLGRVFDNLSREIRISAPEVTQFYFNNDEISADSRKIIDSAVSHLALIKFNATKLSTDNQIRDFDYMIHPILIPFFEFSYRKKRKIRINGSDLNTLMLEPQKAVQKLLSDRNIEDELDRNIKIIAQESFFRL